MRIKQLLIAIGVGTMLAACSSKEDYTTEVERIPIRINASIEGNLIGTRAVENPANLHETSFMDGEVFSVDIVYSGTNNTIPSYLQNGNGMNCVYNNGSIDIGNNVFYPLDGKSIDVFAFYSGISSDRTNYLIHDGTHGVLRDQSSEDGYRLSDFLYASAKGCAGGEPIDLTFHHLMSKIIVKLSGYEGTASQYAVTIKDVQTFTIVNDNPLSDISLGDTPEDQKYIDDIKMGNYDDAGVTAIVIPQTISSGKTLFEVKIGNATYLYRTNSEINFVSGHVYTFNLSFDGAAITTGSIEIEGWTGTDADDHKYNGTWE